MRKKAKGNKKVRHELEDAATYKGLSNEKNVACPSTGEMISEKEYLRRFNNEWYTGSRNGDYKVITSPEGKKEAERNNNNNKRDALSVAIRSGTCDSIDENMTETVFMQAASDAWEWQDVYKYAGPAQARHVIFEQAKRDIDDAEINLDIILSRFVTKMMKLKTLNERKRKQGKK